MHTQPNESLLNDTRVNDLVTLTARDLYTQNAKLLIAAEGIHVSQTRFFLVFVSDSIYEDLGEIFFQSVKVWLYL